MPKYLITVTLRTEDHVDPQIVADHVCGAASVWGGQYHPEDPLFSAYVSVKATCRGFTVQDSDFDNPT